MCCTFCRVANFLQRHLETHKSKQKYYEFIKCSPHLPLKVADVVSFPHPGLDLSLSKDYWQHWQPMLKKR